MPVARRSQGVSRTLLTIFLVTLVVRLGWYRRDRARLRLLVLQGMLFGVIALVSHHPSSSDELAGRNISSFLTTNRVDLHVAGQWREDEALKIASHVEQCAEKEVSPLYCFTYEEAKPLFRRAYLSDFSGLFTLLRLGGGGFVRVIRKGKSESIYGVEPPVGVDLFRLTAWPVLFAFLTLLLLVTATAVCWAMRPAVLHLLDPAGHTIPLLVCFGSLAPFLVFLGLAGGLEPGRVGLAGLIPVYYLISVLCADLAKRLSTLIHPHLGRR